MQNIYFQLTREFNDGRPRAVMSGGQAVVWHRLAIMSKDGDWILRPDQEALAHVLGVLASRGATYRFGAPLDLRWLAEGWSSHLEFQEQGIRVRTDFVTRPPRLPESRLARLWAAQDQGDPPVLGVLDLIATKKTNREKDYVVIGELARLLEDPRDRLLNSRSARDLRDLAAGNPALAADLGGQRPLLREVAQGLEALEVALDAERRALIHANEDRLSRFLKAAEPWARRWPEVTRQMAGRPLAEAHAAMVAEAVGSLPCHVPGGLP